MKSTLFIVSFLFGLTSFARELSIIPKIGSHSIQLNKTIIHLDDTLQITAFKVYISIPHDGKYIIHLLDIEESLTSAIPDEAQMISIGIDSMQTAGTNFSDALDPIHGMFWAWNSGYINVKIEGISRKSIQRGNIFQVHLGGYLNPYSTAFSMSVPTKETIRIGMDLGPCIKAVLNNHGGTLMSPGKHAHELMTILQQSIKIVE